MTEPTGVLGRLRIRGLQSLDAVRYRIEVAVDSARERASKIGGAPRRLRERGADWTLRDRIAFRLDDWRSRRRPVPPAAPPPPGRDDGGGLAAVGTAERRPQQRVPVRGLAAATVEVPRRRYGPLPQGRRAVGLAAAGTLALGFTAGAAMVGFSSSSDDRPATRAGPSPPAPTAQAGAPQASGAADDVLAHRKAERRERLRRTRAAARRKAAARRRAGRARARRRAALAAASQPASSPAETAASPSPTPTVQPTPEPPAPAPVAAPPAPAPPPPAPAPTPAPPAPSGGVVFDSDG
jgi:hypothetical protein